MSSDTARQVGKKHHAIPPSVFETPSQDRDNIIRSLVRHADERGLGVARITAMDPSSDPDGKVAAAELTADSAKQDTDPIGIFLHMEGMIRDWYKHIPHHRPPTHMRPAHVEGVMGRVRRCWGQHAPACPHTQEENHLLP